MLFGLNRYLGKNDMKDESHLPVAEQSLVFRLRKRAEIRRQISTRKSVQEGAPDRMANLLDEAAERIEVLESQVSNLVGFLEVARSMKK